MSERFRVARKRIRESFVKILFFTILLIMTFILLRIFVFSSFRIPSNSMCPAILPGDYVLVNKLAYGARLFNLFDALDNKKVKIKRVKGYIDIKNNDIVVFHDPYPHTSKKIEMDLTKYFIKRCIGIPGDTLRIINGLYVINSDTTKSYGCLKYERILRNKTEPQLPEGVYNTFPWDGYFNWNIKDFGPLYIPRKGDCITMNKKNALLYRKIIEWEKGYLLVYSEGALKDRNEILEQYRFLHDYYFMGGDMVENSRDSRYWGLLPDDFIVGKASFIWKSVDPLTGEIRWDRIFEEL